MATPSLLAITTVTPGVLASAQFASGDTAVYTVPANKAIKVTKMVLVNISTSAVAVAVSVVPSGGSVDGTHRVTGTFTLAAGDSTAITEVEGMFLGQGDFINVNAATASAIDVSVNGLVFG